MTDGDLRRGIDKTNKNKNLIYLIKKNPIIVSENTPAAKALGIMNEKKITCLLVVAEKDSKKKNKKLKGVIHIHNLLQNGIK